MRSRVGEVWEVWNGLSNDDWKAFLVVKTETPSFDRRVHTCLMIDTGKISWVVEPLSALWENTPVESIQYKGQVFAHTIRRRKVI